MIKLCYEIMKLYEKKKFCVILWILFFANDPNKPILKKQNKNNMLLNML